MKRLANETHFEYVKRLTENRKEYDLSYSEWASLITHGASYSNENCRKFYYLVVPLLEALEEDFDKPAQMLDLTESEDLNDLILELETKKLEIQKERAKIQTLKSELNRAVREEGRKELFYEQLLDEVRKNPLPEFSFEPFAFYETPGLELVQVLADIHYGADFDIGENSYSPSICQQRFERLAYETLEICQKEGASHLTVANCGDSIQSLLRLSDLTLNSLTVVEQVIGISRLIANYLNELSRHLTIRYIHTIQANHSEFRLLGTKRGELKEDVELLIGNWIKDLLSNNPRVEVIVASDMIHTESVANYQVGFLHGQDIKNFETFVRDASYHYKTEYSFLICGHIHHLRNITVGRGTQNEAVQIISAPSIVGSCEYSKKLMKSSPAGALMIGFAENRGKYLTYEITL